MSSENEKIPVIYYKGFPFPGYASFNEKNIESAVNYRARDGDYVLCSYPKTGTNWIGYIVWLILNKGDSDEAGSLAKRCPYLERVGTEQAEAMEDPRLCMTHLPHNLFRTNDKAKYLYIFRNPEDVVVSFYHFNNSLIGEVIELDEFFEAFMKGKVCYGDYFDHVLSYHNHKEDENLYIARYEKLRANPREEIIKLARFLGPNFYEFLTENEAVLDKILELISFDSMKKQFTPELDLPGGGKRKLEVFRKGTVGDGKNVLNEEQIKRLRAAMLKKMEGTEFIELWS